MLLLVSGLFSVSVASLAEAAPRFLVRSWQSEDGLPSNAIRAIAQASNGYLWVGTAEGVVRFDGVRFTGFFEASDAAVAWLPVRALFPLANGEVWVSTGSALLRGHGARLEEVRLPSSVGKGAARAVSQVFLGANDDVFALRGSEVWQMSQGQTPRLAAQTPALEKLLQEDAEGGREHSRLPVSAGQFRLRDSQKHLWQFAPGTGLTLADEENQPEQPVPLQGERPAGVTAMLEDREGNLWLGTPTQGLWRLRVARVEMLTTAAGLSDQESLLALEDREKSLWVATRAGGLDCLHMSTVKHFDVSRAPRPVSALCETRSGGMWAATRDGSVFSLKAGGFRRMFEGQSGATRVAAIAEDNQGGI